MKPTSKHIYLMCAKIFKNIHCKKSKREEEDTREKRETTRMYEEKKFIKIKRWKQKKMAKNKMENIKINTHTFRINGAENA